GLAACVADKQDRFAVGSEDGIALLLGSGGHLARLAQLRVHDPQIAAGRERDLQAIAAERDLGCALKRSALLAVGEPVAVVPDVDLAGRLLGSGIEAIQVEELTEDDHRTVARDTGKDDAVAGQPGQLLLGLLFEVILPEVAGTALGTDAVETLAIGPPQRPAA